MPRVPCCANCSVEMVPDVNDVIVIEQTGAGQPTALWLADLWKCPECGMHILAGFGKQAWTQMGDPGFPAAVQDAQARRHFTVKE